MLQLADINKKPMAAALMESMSADLLSDIACRDWLLQYLHGALFSCPACDHLVTSARQQDAFRHGKRVCCKGCGRWFDYRSGTVLAATTLTPRQILLLALLIADGQTPREIADRLRLHEGTIRDWRGRMSLPGGRVIVHKEIR